MKIIVIGTVLALLKFKQKQNKRKTWEPINGFLSTFEIAFQINIGI